jgi:hypothetical protein
VAGRWSPQRRCPSRESDSCEDVGAVLTRRNGSCGQFCAKNGTLVWFWRWLDAGSCGQFCAKNGTSCGQFCAKNGTLVWFWRWLDAGFSPRFGAPSTTCGGWLPSAAVFSQPATKGMTRNDPVLAQTNRQARAPRSRRRVAGRGRCIQRRHRGTTPEERRAIVAAAEAKIDAEAAEALAVADDDALAARPDAGAGGGCLPGAGRRDGIEAVGWSAPGRRPRLAHHHQVPRGRGA